MRIWGIVAAVVLGAAAVVHADPLDFKHVPADARWLVHFDVDAMRQSVVVQRFYHDCIAPQKDVEKHFDELRERIGMDPRMDLHSVTFFGDAIGRHEGVLVVRGTVDQQALLEKARKAADHEVARHGQHEIHSWTHGKGKPHEHKAAGVFFKPDVLVFGSSVDEVKQSLDVLAGKAENLAEKGGPLAAEIPDGTQFVARAVGLSKAELPCKSPLVKRSERFSLAKGESQGEVFVDGTLVTDSSEIAQQLKSVVEGARAMALLQHGHDESLRALVNRLQVSVDGATVHVKFRASAEAVSAQVRKVCQELARMHGKTDCDPKKPCTEGEAK